MGLELNGPCTVHFGIRFLVCWFPCILPHFWSAITRQLLPTDLTTATHLSSSNFLLLIYCGFGNQITKHFTNSSKIRVNELRYHFVSIQLVKNIKDYSCRCREYRHTHILLRIMYKLVLTLWITVGQSICKASKQSKPSD